MGAAPVEGLLDVLKPLVLGRGVDAPMPVILLGALGGMATGGILGMFVGATLLALGYQIFVAWVGEDMADGPAQATGPDAPVQATGPETAVEATRPEPVVEC